MSITKRHPAVNKYLKEVTSKAGKANVAKNGIEEMRRRGRKGGLASGKARRARRSMSQESLGGFSS